MTKYSNPAITSYLLATYDVGELDTFVDCYANKQSFSFIDSYTLLLAESDSFYTSLFEALQIKQAQQKALYAMELSAVNDCYRAMPGTFEEYHLAIDYSEDDADLQRMIENDNKPVVKQARPIANKYRVAGKFCTKSYFIAYLQAKLAILESLVVKLSADLLKDISGKTWQQVITCLKSLYAKIDAISLQLVAIA